MTLGVIRCAQNDGKDLKQQNDSNDNDNDNDKDKDNDNDNDKDNSKRLVKLGEKR